MKSSPVNYSIVPYLDNQFKFGKITWSAILAGLIVCLSFELLFSILGIGLGMLNMRLNISDMSKLLEISTIWLALSGIVAMGLGGWFVGAFSQTYCKIRCFYYVIITWGLAILLTVTIILTIYSSIINNIKYLMIDENFDSQQSVLSKQNTEIPDIKAGQKSATNNLGLSVNQQVQHYVHNLGQLYLIMFVAFVFSCITGIITSIFGCKSVKKI